MYHPPSKRKQLLRRIAVYSLMTFAVVGLVTLLIFFTLGYRFNQDDGVVQTGLVQFGSHPSGAHVTVDEMGFGPRTPSKTTLEAGSHYVTMQRDGYRQWQKSVDVVGGAVLWLNYARLVPTELKPANVASFATVSGTEVSPDAKWMIVTEDPASPTLRIVDFTKVDNIQPSALRLPTTLYTAPGEGESQRFELGQWDSTSRYVTIKHSYGDKYEWLVVDTRDVGASQNITRLLGVDASKLIFNNGSSTVLYAQVDDTLRWIDRSSATLSGPIVEKVAEFSLYGDDTVIFTRQPHEETNKRDVGYYRVNEDKTYTVGSYEGALAHMAIGQYFGDTYTAVARGDTITISTGDLSRPTEWEKVASMKLAGGAQHLSIVTAGRFVIAQNESAYAVYDLELKKATTTQLRGEGEVKDELRWLDGYNIWSDRGGMLRLYEFDGTNQHNIMKVAPGFNVTLGPDAKYLYGITQSGDEFHLTRVQMIL